MSDYYFILKLNEPSDQDYFIDTYSATMLNDYAFFKLDQHFDDEFISILIEDFGITKSLILSTSSDNCLTFYISLLDLSFDAHFERNSLILASDLNKVNMVIVNDVISSVVNDLDFLRVILTYISTNCNVLSTAKVCYIHRNTVLNYISKFNDLTKLNVKIFEDSIIAYYFITRILKQNI